MKLYKTNTANILKYIAKQIFMGYESTICNNMGAKCCKILLCFGILINIYIYCMFWIFFEKINK